MTAENLADLVAQSTLIVIGTTSEGEPRVERVPGRDSSDRSKPDANFTMIGNVYQIEIERYLKGSGDSSLSVIQQVGFDAYVPGPNNSPGMLTQARYDNLALMLGRSNRYLLFLRDHADTEGLWSGTAQPYKFLLVNGDARSEIPLGTLDGAFPNRPESEFIDQVEALIASRGSDDATKTAALRIPNDATWLLEYLDGSPRVDGTHVALRVNGDSLGGFDGCNSFGGRWDDGITIARPDGTFSVPTTFWTQMLCGGPEGIMEQADSYMTALIDGKMFRLDGDRLEIFDETNEVRLIFSRQDPLPGDAIDLVGTAWRLVIEADEGGGTRAPTLALLNDRIAAGATACGGYVAGYNVTDGRLRFAGISTTDTMEECTYEPFHPEDLSGTADYSVEKSSGSKLLSIRTWEGKTLVYEPLPPIVDGIFAERWSLTTFIQPHETASGHTRYSRTTDVIPGTEVTIEFRKDGVSGLAGCNTYGAPTRVDGSKVTIGAAMVTRAWCDDPEGLMEQERRYLGILSA